MELGVDQAYPSRWERGTAFPPAPELVRLIDFLGLDVDQALRALAADLLSQRSTNGGHPPDPAG